MIGVKYYGIVGAAAGALFVSVVYGLIIYGLYIRTIMHKWWQYFCLPILLCSLLAYMTFAKISITLKISLLAIVLISYFGFYLFNNVKNFLAIRKEIQLGSFYG
jgi:hypothetical protein